MRFKFIFYTRKLEIKPCMQIILPKLSKAHILIWATLIYYAGITGPLKNLMDRQLPLHMIDEEEGAVYKRGDGGSDFAGALLRPHAEVMKQLIAAGERQKVDGVFNACKEAGRLRLPYHKSESQHDQSWIRSP